MKKCMLIAFITIFTLSVVGATCYAAARTMANTSKKGSLLIFPLIKAGLKASQDTVISISNDYYAAVHLECIYKLPTNCFCDPFNFTLTPNQEISFSAKTGKGLDGDPIPKIGTLPEFDLSTVGELKCWATDNNATMHHPISFNWLSGQAIIGEDDNRSWAYSAWRFAVGSGIPNLGLVGVPGTLRLTGTPFSYDACPSRLMFNFIEQTPTATGPFPMDVSDRGGTFQTANDLLTLIPCK